MRVHAVLIVLITAMLTCGATVIGIDDDTVISVEQAGSVAPSAGDYGWDSRGAVVSYMSADGGVRGSLGTVWFEDDSGVRKNFMWDQWGKHFPDSWNRRIADNIVRNTPDNGVAKVREAFGRGMQIECEWIIAIGTKSTKAGGELYKTLRTDNTLRVAYDKNLGKLNPPERLFAGDEMFDSLSTILKGQTWGSGTLATFAERNPYRYTISINSYDIEVYATNCTSCAKNGLRTKGGVCPHVEEGTYFCVEVPIERGGAEYVGEKSFAWEGQSVNYVEKNYSGYTRNKSADDSSLVRGTINGRLISPIGDSILFLAYSEAGGSSQGEGEGQGHDDAGAGGYSHYIVNEREFDYYPNAGGVINSHYFNVAQAIPSTEAVFVNASAKSFLYDFDASVASGQYSIPITVIFPYELNWTETVTSGEGESLTSVSVPHSVKGSQYVQTTIYRSYSYVHLNSFAFYTLNGITVSNPVMRPETVFMSPSEAGTVLPLCSYPTVFGGIEPVLNENISYPYNYSGTITAPVRVINGGSLQPAIPSFTESEARNVAESSVGPMVCRNDELFFDGMSVTGEIGWHEYHGQAQCNTQVLSARVSNLNSERIFGSRFISIPALISNKTYHSIGYISYSPVILYNSVGIDYQDSFYVNDISVFTPVICNPYLEDCNKQVPNSTYIEEIGVVSNRYDMVMSVGRCGDKVAKGHENDSCDFFMEVGNTGIHPTYAGILGRNYNYRQNISQLNGGSYVMKNEVFFPFDVYLDEGVLYDERDDVLILAGTWFRIGNSMRRFYLPTWTAEGDYYIQARTCAINYEGSLSYSESDIYEDYANTDRHCYVATGELSVHVSGKLFGLKLTNVDSDFEWKEVFEKRRWGEVAYSVGINNELGYAREDQSRFILPLLDGSHPDTQRENTGQLKTGYEWTLSINTTGQKMSELGSYIHIVPVFHTLDGHNVSLRYRETFVGRGYSDVYVGSDTDSINVKKFGNLGWYTYAEITVLEPVHTSKGEQRWEFRYSLPTKIKLSEGNMLVVGFEITAYSGDEPYLSYYCDASEGNMWEVEGQQLNRKDYYGREYRFEYGDVLLLDTTRTKADDYVTDKRY